MSDIKYESLDDEDIRYYLPDARIMKYSELSKYTTIEQLLPKHKSYVVLLYPVSSETSGHWICICRFNITIEYFDSYGGKPDSPFNWSTSNYKNNKRYLTDLFKKTKSRVTYNSIDFQSKKDMNISTCGAFAVFRVLTMIELDADISKNNLLLKSLKQSNEDLSYDDIVVNYINKR